MATGIYELHDVISAVIGTLERQVRHSPADLIFELVLETYRLERQALANGATEDDLAYLFLEPFELAHRDGLIPPGADVVRAARVGQMLVADGIRHWAATDCDGALAKEITALVHGLW